MVGADVVGERLIRQHDAVPQHVEGDLADVGGQRVIAAAGERQRASAGHQCDRGARAGPVADVPLQVESRVQRQPGRGHQPHGVVDHGGVDVDVAHPFLHVDQVRRVEHRADRLGGAQRAVDDRVFLVGTRIADDHLHHEPVDLRLGQRVGAF
jgi:hypothetical protein